MSPGQNLNSLGMPTRLRYSADSIRFFAGILSRHSPYCSWHVYENYFRKPGSRKEGCVYFRARAKTRAKCTIEGCPHNANLTISSPQSIRMQISFDGGVIHKLFKSF